MYALFYNTLVRRYFFPKLVWRARPIPQVVRMQPSDSTLFVITLRFFDSDLFCVCVSPSVFVVLA